MHILTTFCLLMIRVNWVSMFSAKILAQVDQNVNFGSKIDYADFDSILCAECGVGLRICIFDLHDLSRPKF